MNIDPMMSDAAVLLELGHRLSRRRVELELTQADLAREAGVAKRTVERVEADIRLDFLFPGAESLVIDQGGGPEPEDTGGLEAARLSATTTEVAVT